MRMTDDGFRIFVEQLREGHTEEIAEVFAPEFLDVQEKELVLDQPVKVNGQVYLADEMLVLHLDIATQAMLPCSVCNEPVSLDLSVKGFYHAVPLSEIKGGIYDLREILRETILLEVPLLAECRQGNCPKRKAMKKFLKKEGSPGSGDEGEGYRPFANLDLDLKDR